MALQVGDRVMQGRCLGAFCGVGCDWGLVGTLPMRPVVLQQIG